MSVWRQGREKTVLRLCGFAQKFLDEQYLPPGEGTVPALVAGLAEGFDKGMATGYPAHQVAHGGFGDGIGKVLQGKFLFGHGSLIFFCCRGGPVCPPDNGWDNNKWQWRVWKVLL